MQTIKLSELKNIAYIIAKAEIEAKGVYFCVVNGIKTRVVK
jgi:hypothetical protein